MRIASGANRIPLSVNGGQRARRLALSHSHQPKDEKRRMVASSLVRGSLFLPGWPHGQ
jgi:hypothetical protein